MLGSLKLNKRGDNILDKRKLYEYIKTEFDLVMNEQIDNVSKNTILCNLMTRLERNFSYMPIMSPLTNPKVKQYFDENPEELEIKQLYDIISDARM